MGRCLDPDGGVDAEVPPDADGGTDSGTDAWVPDAHMPDPEVDSGVDSGMELDSGVDGGFVPPPDGCVSITETCNGADDDCDGRTDEGLTTTFYRDSDMDGYGAADSTMSACTMPAGYVSSSTDCDDTRMSVRPGGTESCNGLNDDCDANTDEGVRMTFYRDSDMDGYGAAGMTMLACTMPAGYVSSSTDCDDTRMSARPGGSELCNGLDDDCVSGADNGFTCVQGAMTSCTTTCGSTGTGVCTAACARPTGASCTAPAEVCDGDDDDCDGNTDERLQIRATPRTIATVSSGVVDLAALGSGFIAAYTDSSTGLYVLALDATGAVVGSPLLVTSVPTREFSLSSTGSYALLAFVDGTTIRAATFSTGVSGVSSASSLTMVGTSATLNRVRSVASGSSAIIYYHDGTGIRAYARTMPSLSGSSSSTSVVTTATVTFDAVADPAGSRAYVAYLTAASGGDVRIRRTNLSGTVEGSVTNVTADVLSQRTPSIAFLVRPDGTRQLGVLYGEDEFPNDWAACYGAANCVYQLARYTVAADGTLSALPLRSAGSSGGTAALASLVGAQGRFTYAYDLGGAIMRDVYDSGSIHEYLAVPGSNLAIAATSAGTVGVLSAPTAGGAGQMAVRACP